LVFLLDSIDFYFDIINFYFDSIDFSVLIVFIFTLTEIVLIFTLIKSIGFGKH